MRASRPSGRGVEELLESLARGILSDPVRVEDLPAEQQPLGRALLAIRARWHQERVKTIEQATAALRRSEYEYRREHERAEELEAAQRELCRTQAQLLHASKLASLGTLAAGVAHEINQPLTVILGLAEMLAMQPGDSIESHSDDLDQITRAAERVAVIVGNIRTFGRQDEQFCPAATSFTEPLERAIELFDTRLRVQGVDVVRRYQAPADQQVWIDSSRMQQVFVNLLANASDALTEARVERPRIELDVTSSDTRLRYIVADNGPGVPLRAVERIFDPFFTTKEVGKGTGLGLAVSHSIVEQHGGELRYERAGTRSHFVIELPVGA